MGKVVNSFYRAAYWAVPELKLQERKVMGLTYKELFSSTERIKDRADFADRVAAEILGKPFGLGNIRSIDENGVSFDYEYNNACHCHPEYMTDEYFIPAEWLDFELYTDYEYRIPDSEAEQNVRNLILAKKAEEDRKAAERKEKERIEAEATAAALRAETERREKETFERLKAKYESKD